jgi:hypothetical protein
LQQDQTKAISFTLGPQSLYREAKLYLGDDYNVEEGNAKKAKFHNTF